MRHPVVGWKNKPGIKILDEQYGQWSTSEAKKIATMAEAHQLPVAPHDCTGPVVLCASTHLSLNAPNALIQESVRAYYKTWYRDLVTALPEVRDGFITVPEGPGLGLELAPDLAERFTASTRISKAE